MKHLVILDARSAIGRIYAKGNNDGNVSDGDTLHPVLECTDLVTDNPYYIHATRPLKKGDGSHQLLFLPHGSVVAIYQYALDEPSPLGFL